MIADAPSWPPVSALLADNKGGTGENLASEGKSKGFSLTSHTLSLTTRLFSLDFTWRRLEVEDSRPAPRDFRNSKLETALPARVLNPPPPSFAEVLKRQQLASLLVDQGSSPADGETIQSSAGQQASFYGTAKRAYNQTGAGGPLTGERVYKA